MDKHQFTLIVGDKNIHDWQKELDKLTWPIFLLKDIQNAGSWAFVYEHFQSYQFAYFDGDQLVGIGNAMGIYYDLPLMQLPQQGLDWAAQKSKEDITNRLAPNTMVAIQIILHPAYKNKGLSYLMVKTMKEIALSNSLAFIALPVRPNLKSQFPFMPIEVYLNKKDLNGLPFDPWLRVHTKLGASLIGPCHQSMFVSGSVRDWEEWSGQQFGNSGLYAVEGALMPINIDLINDIGVYVEPNVWMVHPVS